MKMYELEILVYDKDEYSIISSATKYYCSNMFKFSGIEKIKEKLPNIINNIENYNEEIINIFAIEYILDDNLENQENGIIFFDKEGNVKSEISNKEMEEEVSRNIENKYKAGDFVYIVNRTYNTGENNIEFGVVSQVPDKKIKSNFYNILVGNDIHNHTHVIEEFLFPYDDNISHEIYKKCLEDRLYKIGY